MTIDAADGGGGLSDAQRRTLRDLIGQGPAPASPPDLAAQVRDALDRRLAGLFDRAGRAGDGSAPPVWIGKRRLNERERCEGRFHADLLGEGPSFEHSDRTAAGTLFHRAIEVDLATERVFDPRSVAEHAGVRLVQSDVPFGVYWRSLDPLARAELQSEAGRRLHLFRDSFPPIPRRWSPQPELRMRALLAGGSVVLTGTPDLVLGRRRRLILDLKSGGAWPEYAEDLRFYALLALLRTGVLPYRVATFFLESGSWQAEDVTAQVVDRAADRVVETVRTALSLTAGAAPPSLSPGRHCDHCPRRAECPALRASVA